jgi:hypothetical protein
MLTTLQDPTEDQYPPKSPDSPSTTSVRPGGCDYDQDGADRPLLAELCDQYGEETCDVAAGEDQ